MANYTFLKQHPTRNAHLARLYQNIYMEQLGTLLRSYNLFDNADYYLRDYTYDDQLSVINIALITDKANIVTDKIPDIKLSFSEDVIRKNITILELSRKQLLDFDLSEVQKALEKIHKVPFQNFADFEVYDSRKKSPLSHIIKESDKPRHTHPYIFVAKATQLAPFQDNPAFLALFWHVQQTILRELSHVLSSQYSVNILDIKERYDDIVLYSIEHQLQDAVPIEEIEDHIEPAYGILLYDGVIESIINYIQSDFYSLPMGGIPDNLTHKNMGVMCGIKGWRSLATDENIRMILANTDLFISNYHQEVRINLDTNDF